MTLVKQLAQCLALVALSPGALAEWAELMAFEDGIRVYVDKATVKRTADTAQVLHLVRWHEPQVDDGLPPYRSTIVRVSYDCSSKREKYLASVSYAGPMGNGAKVVADSDEAQGWYSISDASLEEALWKVACGRD